MNPDQDHKPDLTANEAARLLGVSLSTLYSYVSRGLLISVADGTARSKRYPYDAVMRLAARRADGKRAGHQVTAAMNWGVPVMESTISHVSGGSLYYRGHDVCRLADQITLETTALLLWGYPQADFFECPVPKIAEAELLLARQLSAGMGKLEQALALLGPLTHRLDLHATEAPAMFFDAATFMRLLAALLLDQVVDCTALHEQVARAWQANAAQTEIIRASLVLLADHELNASTFTVRCVASAGASLAATLSAGLAALSGRRHAGGSKLAREMIIGALAASDASVWIRQFYRRHKAAGAGFAHPLYPAGDPRAQYLLKQLEQVAGEQPQVKKIFAIGRIAMRETAALPNADFALAALQLAFGWPDHAAEVLYALARSAGWVAHAAEQQADGKMIRPRARYIGKLYRQI
ncbi:citrate synthase family protein [Undibacterium sp. TS12]|uniref:citrate synthase family protein n=1 Tax=Undibacterium sp. TS12 TaxID=2908202 RepID=UPI001F4C5F49|nr:citrate synthase family protein [Undibacterium sp. TS12]MCH8621601.1 citrate synthase family protein [Undibacterium sp. TS12]